MISSSIQRLQYLTEMLPPRLTLIKEEDFSDKPAPHKWSKKQILGHLIDSATNNHQRFIRVQFEQTPTIVYKQNEWNALSYYQQLDSGQLIQFWTLYNKQLIHIIRHIPEQNLQKECNAGGQAPVTLEWLINDYVAHLEHHLHQIVDYN